MKKQEDGRRVARAEREVQQAIAQFLISGFKLPLPGIVTVARVKMPGDLRAAKVYISVLGAPEGLNKAVELLKERAFEVQNFLGKELKMRYCPKLTFLPDHETEQILKVDRILQELEADRQAKKPTSSVTTSESEDDSSEEA
ncbi:MAG: 30S ribosome-binding factor RbfA [Bdellovibrionaceae bacterium]|nr:30S ribosome-binding factor RbfA [Pseudobdellovibrionaceae bacterium]